ncbi:MAG: hypothetical protein HY606_11550 [Planctomycetes bacterium]|nr:hypothetical protein [Planctomycetota bacterium]
MILFRSAAFSAIFFSYSLLYAGQGDVPVSKNDAQEGTTRTITQVKWQPDVLAAMEQAQKKNKMVMVLQTVGDINGYI